MSDPTSKRPGNIADVARMAGVSAGTVSNVLNKPHVVAESTRQRVEEVLRRTGFVRNAAARQLAGARSSTVGCVLPDLSNPYFAEVARGIEDGLGEQGCMAIMASSHADPERELRYLHRMAGAGTRAVLLHSVQATPGDLTMLTGRNIPVVLMGNSLGRRDRCAVASDGVTGARMVVDHLLGLGHRRIAVICHETDILPPGEREVGIRAAIAARGLDVREVVTEVSMPPLARAGDPGPAVEAVLSGPSPCTAVVCFNDMAALLVMAGLRSRGVRVPGRVSVVGYGDLDVAALLSPGLTTVRQSAYGIGRLAAELAVDEGRCGHEHRQIPFAPELVVRDSTGSPVVSGITGSLDISGCE